VKSGTVLLVAVATAIGLLGCRGDAATVAGCPTAEGAPAIDEAVMAFLSAARALHHEADLKERSGDAPGAIATLERLIALPSPPRAVEVDEVIADAHARLAELRLSRGDVDGASRDVHAGLERVESPTYFRGHLLELEGIVEEKRASLLADAGRPAEAAKARALAVGLLEEAVHVQEGVIERALAEAGAHE
jgi:hypothetical protein